jgi:hypothetical protein
VKFADFVTQPASVRADDGVVASGARLLSIDRGGEDVLFELVSTAREGLFYDQTEKCVESLERLKGWLIRILPN